MNELSTCISHTWPPKLVFDEYKDLDAESISWLEQFLSQFKGTVVCITHDRYFLENVAGKLERDFVHQSVSAFLNI